MRFSRFSTAFRFSPTVLASSCGALLLTALPRGAYAQTLLVSGLAGQFGTLNVTTGVYQSRGTNTYNGATVALSGLANATNGNLYGLELTSTATPRLFQVSRTNGLLSLVGSVSGFSPAATTGLGGSSIGNTSDGTIYAFYSSNVNNTNSTIYKINASSAVATTVGASGKLFDGAINGDNTGKLFGTGGDDGTSTYQISTTSGAATTLQATTTGGSVFGMAFTNGNLYALNNSGGIFTVNTSTGATTNTGLTYSTSVAGQIYGAAELSTPEPGTLPLVGMGFVTGAAMVATIRRRKAKQQAA